MHLVQSITVNAEGRRAAARPRCRIADRVKCSWHHIGAQEQHECCCIHRLITLSVDKGVGQHPHHARDVSNSEVIDKMCAYWANFIDACRHSFDFWRQPLMPGLGASHVPVPASSNSDLCRQVTGVKDDEIGRAAEMVGAAITSAAPEAATVLDDTSDPEVWAGALTEVLAAQDFAFRGTNVIEFGNFTLSRLAMRPADELIERSDLPLVRLAPVLRRA